MSDPFDRLRRTDQATGAAPHCFAVLAHRMATASRASVRKDIRFRVRWPLLRQDVEDLRNDVAGALDHHRVADPDVAPFADRLAAVADALDVILVVKRRIDDDDTTNRDRLQ